VVCILVNKSQSTAVFNLKVANIRVGILRSSMKFVYNQYLHVGAGIKFFGGWQAFYACHQEVQFTKIASKIKPMLSKKSDLRFYKLGSLLLD
jgi:hypothetical protein